MVVRKNSIVGIYYRVNDSDGSIIDSNEDFEPLQYLQGAGNILPALEAAIEAASINEERKIVLEPGEGYGDYNKQFIISVSREEFAAGGEQPQQGMKVERGDGVEMEVIAMDEDKVILDGNHPLAGKTLYFHVRVVAIREATPGELQQGQPLPPDNKSCGPGCCC
jgi:FKBP-type peptidyl-prolyl cis-trans isomerase SlyD